jgi:hypothetical protein
LEQNLYPFPFQKIASVRQRLTGNRVLEEFVQITDHRSDYGKYYGTCWFDACR